MFNVDIMAMVSYDQMHFTDTNALALLYLANKVYSV